MCQTCKHAYTGQTSRDLNTRYKDHIRYIRNNESKSAYSQHILENQHEFGQVHNTMTLLQTCHRRNKILHWENLYIQNYYTEGKLIKEQTPHEHNILFRLATLHTTSNPQDVTCNTQDQITRGAYRHETYDTQTIRYAHHR